MLDLPEHLRTYGRYSEGDAADMVLYAADRINSLVAELAEAREARDKWEQLWKTTREALAFTSAESEEKLRQENEQLRNTLDIANKNNAIQAKMLDTLIMDPIDCAMWAAKVVAVQQELAAARTGDGITAAMRALPNDEERYAVISEFCRQCGSLDPRCQCWNDE